MLAISQQPRMSIKKYLEWEPQQDLHHEYINGEVMPNLESQTTNEPPETLAIQVFICCHIKSI